MGIIHKVEIGRALAALLALVLLAGLGYSQKTEHYRSPLYSPRVYDPAQSTSNGLPAALQEIGIEQRLGEQLPLDTVFTDEDGREVSLGSLLSKGRPAVLAFVYYECPMLCNEVLNGLTGSLKGIELNAGKDFDVIAISFDVREHGKPGLAKNKKTAYMERYARPGTEAGWHFLTGSEASVREVTQAAGFKFKWDEKSEQFAHSGGVMIVTPEGRLSRYLYGIDYAPKDLKFSLMDSAENRVGSMTDSLLLYCYHYDPSTGKYGFAIMKAIRVAGVLTLLAMGAMGLVFWRRNKRRI